MREIGVTRQARSEKREEKKREEVEEERRMERKKKERKEERREEGEEEKGRGEDKERGRTREELKVVMYAGAASAASAKWEGATEQALGGKEGSVSSSLCSGQGKMGPSPVWAALVRTHSLIGVSVVRQAEIT
ncbi:uncharacterized protein TRUGW13939_04358 [Talaromyces rugulosus]|uniref:Uncharacterized protein n=1 Tax=Talaromyces rugulosus TaxID=121627 RepID=A0A7H8QTD7_TALRU|nr:uncharacterized protein TRUGW13939_04358 [Talaromyces rugulosus]QKX57250.1 hypothetical protein TRUGW13939_04358 [Talaromyces rugulosus]